MVETVRWKVARVFHFHVFLWEWSSCKRKDKQKERERASTWRSEGRENYNCTKKKYLMNHVNRDTILVFLLEWLGIFYAKDTCFMLLISVIYNKWWLGFCQSLSLLFRPNSTSDSINQIFGRRPNDEENCCAKTHL